MVDYVETRTELPALLQAVAADAGRRVRVLLLARSAGEWWQRLGGESAAVRRMVTAAGQGMALAEETTSDAADTDTVVRAIPYFAGELKVSPPRQVEVDLGQGPRRVLDLRAAALVAVLRHSSALLPLPAPGWWGRRCRG